MRIAVLYDIHANLPALESVLQDIREAEVDQVVVGGDVVPGPMPRETLRRLLDLNVPVQFIHGNGELAILAQMAATDGSPVTYWGTTSGAPLPEPLQEVYRWTAQQLQPEYEPVIASWPKTLRLEIDGLGPVLFCHSTPRSETEVFTRLTPEDRLLPLFEGLMVSVVVCGHTHMQFDRMIGKTRIVNAGSVGEPFGKPGAFWLLLGPDVQLRQTSYDLTSAAERIRATQYPRAEEFAAHSVLQPPSEAEILELFGKAELRQSGAHDRLLPGTIVDCEPIGLLVQDEGGEVDHKVLAAMPGQNVELGPGVLRELQDFIHTVFAQHPEISVRVGPILPRAEALLHIQECREA